MRIDFKKQLLFRNTENNGSIVTNVFHERTDKHSKISIN